MIDLNTYIAETSQDNLTRTIFESNFFKNEDEYAKKFSFKDFEQNIKGIAKKAGRKVVYGALLLYYALVAMRDKEGTWADVSWKIKAALGYVLFPFDLVPDNLGPLGWVDDLVVIILIINWIETNYKEWFTPEVKEKAREKFESMFGSGEFDDNVNHWNKDLEDIMK